MKKIRAYWYSPPQHGTGDFENFGDRIAEEIIEFLSLTPPQWTNPKKTYWYHGNHPIYLTIGSIIKRSTKHCVIWGSGIKEEKRPPRGIQSIRCVRGPISRKFLLDHGYEAPPIYGDPGLLLPFIYPPSTNTPSHLGVIPHYVDYKKIKSLLAGDPTIKVIDLCASPSSVIAEITSCRATVSSSLHGIITSHAYQIPCVQVEFSSLISGSGIKFRDYFESVKIPPYPPFQVTHPSQEPISRILQKISHEFEEIALPQSNIIQERQRDLLTSCPFLDESMRTRLLSLTRG